MSDQGYSTSFTVEQTPAQAFAAINDVRGWWAEQIDGSTEKLGDVFTFRHKDVHRSTQKLIEVVPNAKVVWLVLDAELSFVQERSEWKGTRVVFEIRERGGKTEVRFTHQGLVPRCECFDGCSSAWSFYIGGSLRSLIATGKGQPIQSTN